MPNQLIWTCPVCKVSGAVRAGAASIQCACGHVQANGSKPGLGDFVAATLAKAGITKDRYQDAKAALGLKRTCNCGRRQKKLNELGKKIGIG